MSEQNVPERVVAGVRIGLVAAGALTVFASPLVLVRALVALPAPGGLSFFAIAAVYLLGGVLGGAVLGLLWNMRKWWLGRRLLGIVGAVPATIATAAAVVGVHQLTWGGGGLSDMRIWLVTAAIYGLVMSFAFDDHGGPRRRRHRATGLLGPSRPRGPALTEPGPPSWAGN